MPLHAPAGPDDRRIFYFARRYHHQIGKLHHDNDDLRQFLGFLRIVDIRDRLNLGIETLKIAHAVLQTSGNGRSSATAQLRRRTPFRVIHNRNQKMRNTVVCTCSTNHLGRS